jgi:hypothetical protein
VRLGVYDKLTEIGLASGRGGRPVVGVVLENVIELLIYHQPGVKPSLTLRLGVLGYVAGHSLTNVKLPAGLGFNSRGGT